MGVPALFRWLSKKYPKIIYPVVEEEEVKIPDENDDIIVIPPRMADPNPNGTEFDNLYLDMNGIVHPCTHPEGKPAPETEEEMMLEIFKYTERVVDMVRPRKLLFMAIDGVAPRAKMNQQRSRRFRASQEAKEKEEARKESLMLWEAMGKTLSDEEMTDASKPPWDSNAITPGTPFMSLLAASLRYWVASKMNTDAGWKGIQVIISDASVPGEGEHKIMDWIRRQRVNPGHDPNTRHVIYGLDADLIMLALATHEPNFHVLREDVFGESNSTACRICGQEGHYAAQCTAERSSIQKKPPPDKKPFIFLDVSILREYLEVELNVSFAAFPFDFERAIDDWVLLIFFVGNDFLPHLPSLEIREGAIDTLLKIWKQELPRMGGYLTNSGRLEMERVGIILEGLAKREDEIFRKRREVEERQEANSKRRKLEEENSKNGFTAGPSSALGLTASTSSLTSNTLHPSLPPRPDFSINNFAAKADSMGFGAKPNAESNQNVAAATQALGGSNHDIVANRRAFRMANMSAAEALKAELAGLIPVKSTQTESKVKTGVSLTSSDSMGVSESNAITSADSVAATSTIGMIVDEHEDIPGFGARSTVDENVPAEPVDVPTVAFDTSITVTHNEEAKGADDIEIDLSPGLAGTKRKHEDMDTAVEGEINVIAEEDDEPPADGPHSSTTSSLTYKVNPDGTVAQEDNVKLWESGYRERYYRQKFGVEMSDKEFRKQITKSYVEGMAWVLCYYYQGTPSWQWYYPYHFAPFAADFEEVDKMDIKFEEGQPFKPYEQLMGVFPAASRKHIPEPFHWLMTEEDSPIIDFYPLTFEIDMNGKKMAWQGVALLPFIDPVRLLDAMKGPYTKLTEDEVRRNTWGDNMIITSNEHPIHPFYEQLYGKRRPKEPLQIDPKISKGINGSVLPSPDCLPGSTYLSPLVEQKLPDIKNDSSLSVLYFFPKQIAPHRSVLLPGISRAPRVLSASDLEHSRNGGRGRGRGSGGGGGGRGRGGGDRNDSFRAPISNYDRGGGMSRAPYQGPPDSYAGGYGSDRGRNRPPSGGGYGGGGSGYGGGRGRGGPPPGNSYGGYGGGGPPPSTGGYRGYGGGRGEGGGNGSYSGRGYGGAAGSYGNSGSHEGPAGGYGGYGNGGAYGGYGNGGEGHSNSGGSYGYGRGRGGGYDNNGYGGSVPSNHGGFNNHGGYNQGAAQGGGSYNSVQRGRGRGW